MTHRHTLALMAGILSLTASAQSADTYSRKTNLPAVYIRTFNNQSIYSKTDYVYATMWIVDEKDEVTRYDSLQIRGRGNSTWNMSKKPYRIKLHEKSKLQGKGFANAKKWTLLANAADKSLIRNALTSEVGRFLGMPFNPAARFVDLTLNGTYMGNYQISDQMEVKKKRVDITEQDLPLAAESDITGGYFLEVDGFQDGNCFTTSHDAVPIRIHYPDEEDIAFRQNQYIKTYIQAFENALCSNDFADRQKGYRQWVDSVSLANWYIATEVSANIDGFYSTYFYKNQQDSLLYWGPLWDYDIAYANDTRKGNTTRQMMTDVGYGQTRLWVNRMWNDPWFARLVNRRYEQALQDGLTEYMTSKIDSLQGLLQESQQLNYRRWGINTRMYHERVLYSSYDQYVEDLKTFVKEHNEYLASSFTAKKPAEPTPPFTPGPYYYRLTNANTAKAFDIAAPAGTSYSETDVPDAGTQVCTWSNDPDRISEEWQITAVGSHFFLQNRCGGLALCDDTPDPSTATTNTGRRLSVARPDSTDDRQLWALTPQGTEGFYNLTNLHTQHTANLSGGSTANGAEIISYTTDSRNATSHNRLWYIIPSSELPSRPNAIRPVEPAEYALAYDPVLKALHFGAEKPEELSFAVRVTDLSGKTLRTFDAQETCSIADLPDGIYIVSWKAGGTTRSIKFRK